MENVRDDEQALAYSEVGMSNVSLLDDDEEEERAGLVSGEQSTATNRRVERHMTLREKLERLKQQASAKFKSIKEDLQTPKELQKGVGFNDIQKAIEETIVKMTDPLYKDLDYESTLTFVDDIKSWSGGMPQMLPLVVNAIDKRLRNEDPHVTYLTLCLADSLVKNTSQRFHSCVATQPVMSTIARVARGSAHKMQIYTGDLRRDSKMMWQKLQESVSRNSNSGDSEQRTRQRSRNARVAQTKAKEVIKVWGEGFVSTQASLPLFASTYQTLLNEGMDFGDVNLEGAIVLDKPDEFSFAHTGTEHAARGGGALAMSELSDSAHQTAKLLCECVAQGADGDGEDDGGLIALLVDQCHAQRTQLASYIEIAMGSNDEAQLISALAANEALQEALALATGKGNGDAAAAGPSGSGAVMAVSTGVAPATAVPAAAPSAFESTMNDVDALLGFDSNSPRAAATAAPATTSDSTTVLLDIDFLSPAAAPPLAPAPAMTATTAPSLDPLAPAAVAAPSFPPPAAAATLAAAPPTVPSASLAAPAGATPFEASGNPFEDDEEDEFAGLALQRKQKGNNRLQDL